MLLLIISSNLEIISSSDLERLRYLDFRFGFFGQILSMDFKNASSMFYIRFKVR